MDGNDLRAVARRDPPGYGTSPSTAVDPSVDPVAAAGAYPPKNLLRHHQLDVERRAEHSACRPSVAENHRQHIDYGSAVLAVTRYSSERSHGMVERRSASRWVGRRRCWHQTRAGLSRFRDG